MATIESTDAAILSRVVRVDQADFSIEAAQAVLQLRFNRDDLASLQELITRNQNDSLDPADRSELESYLRISSFLDLMQAKARRSLTKHS